MEAEAIPWLEPINAIKKSAMDIAPIATIVWHATDEELRRLQDTAHINIS
jgi:hypothetical protein